MGSGEAVRTAAFGPRRELATAPPILQQHQLRPTRQSKRKPQKPSHLLAPRPQSRKPARGAPRGGARVSTPRWRGSLSRWTQRPTRTTRRPSSACLRRSRAAPALPACRRTSAPGGASGFHRTGCRRSGWRSGSHPACSSSPCLPPAPPPRTCASPSPRASSSPRKRGPAKQDLPRSPARDLAHCAYCQRTDCQCPVKSQLGRRLSFSRRSSVRRVWLDDRGRGEPPTSLSHRGQHTDTGAPLLHAQASGPRSRPRRASRRRWPRRACRRATRSRSSSPRRRWPRGRGRPPPPALPSPPC